jgi:hypothetical protein
MPILSLNGLCSLYNIDDSESRTIMQHAHSTFIGKRLTSYQDCVGVILKNELQWFSTYGLTWYQHNGKIKLIDFIHIENGVFRVATETTHEVQDVPQPQAASKSVLTGIAMIGGLGITLMMLALGIGVVLPDAPSDIIGLVVALGVGLLITSIAGWIIATRPYEHFDDITVPQYHGHHHEEESSDSH